MKPTTTKGITVWLEKNIYQKLQEIKKKDDRSVSHLVERAIINYLKLKDPNWDEWIGLKEGE